MMKKMTALFVAFSMLLQTAWVFAEDSAWESDEAGQTTGAADSGDLNSVLSADEADTTPGYIRQEEDGGTYTDSDYTALFEQPLVEQDFSDQMNEPYAKYGIFLCGTIQDQNSNKYNAGTSGGGKLTEEALRNDITANLPELQVERILSGNYAFVANSKSYWAIDQKAELSAPALMDSTGSFSIPSAAAYELFHVSYSKDYVPASYIEKVTDYQAFTDVRGFLLFSKNVGASVDTSLTGTGENQYYSDFYWISDCIGTIAWEDLHPTAEQYAAFRSSWMEAITYPAGYETEYSDYIADSIASAKEYMAHIDRNNPVNSPFDNIYIPDLYQEGYSSSHANQQGIEQAYAGILAMARGYCVAKRTGETGAWMEQLRDDIIYATMYMREKHLSNNIYELAGTPRFTSFRITCFYNMCNAFIMMGDDLPKQVVYDTLMEFLGRNRYVTSTYTNRFWLAMPHILTGMILEDDTRLNHGYRYLNQCFAEVKRGEEHPMDTEGFFEDGSYPYHGGLAYNLGYGQSFVISVSELVSVTAGTVFDVSRVYSFENMYKWIKIAWLPFIYKNMKMKMVVGREAPYASGRHPVAAMLLIADTAPEATRREFLGYIKPAVEGVEQQFYTHVYFPVFRSLSYPYIIESIRGILDEVQHVEGVETTEYNKVYYNMDRIVHKREDWMFGLALSSARTGKYESSNTTPVSSLTEWYISDGMTYLHNDDVQYLAPWWQGDPYYLSGTTVDDTVRSTKQTMSMSAQEWGKPENLWAGGATTGTIGAAAYDNGNQFVTGLQAQKSYFMFENLVVCLGTGITGGSGVAGTTGNAYTVVERRQLVEEPASPPAGGPEAGYEDVVVDGQTLAVDFETTDSFEDPEWIWVEDRTGYVFSGEHDITVKREVRNGYSFLKVAAQHGTMPENGRYAYTLLPIATQEETAAYAENPEVEIIEQTDRVHAVRQKATGVIMANIWQAATLEGIYFETPCTVIIVPESDGSVVYVADPTQKRDEIELVFPQDVTVLGDYASADGARVTVTVRERPGDTYSFLVVSDAPSEGTSALKTYSYRIQITGNTAATTLNAYGQGKVRFEIVQNGSYGKAVIFGNQLLYTTQLESPLLDIIQVRGTDEQGNSGVFLLQIQRSVEE